MFLNHRLPGRKKSLWTARFSLRKSMSSKLVALRPWWWLSHRNLNLKKSAASKLKISNACSKIKKRATKSWISTLSSFRSKYWSKSSPTGIPQPLWLATMKSLKGSWVKQIQTCRIWKLSCSQLSNRSLTIKHTSVRWAWKSTRCTNRTRCKKRLISRSFPCSKLSMRTRWLSLRFPTATRWQPLSKSAWVYSRNATMPTKRKKPPVTTSREPLLKVKWRTVESLIWTKLFLRKMLWFRNLAKRTETSASALKWFLLITRNTWLR